MKGDTGDGNYLYMIRIVDYFRKSLWWFGSAFSTETTYTLPEGHNLPEGNSYRWQVNVMDASGNNFRSSSYFTFTFNSAPAPSIIYVDEDDATCNNHEPCYTSIQNAIDAAASTASIRLAEGLYNEKFWLFHSKTITLDGGWDTSYNNQNPNKTFIKTPFVNAGSLGIKMLTVKP